MADVGLFHPLGDLRAHLLLVRGDLGRERQLLGRGRRARDLVELAHRLAADAAGDLDVVLALEDPRDRERLRTEDAVGLTALLGGLRHLDSVVDEPLLDLRDGLAARALLEARILIERLLEDGIARVLRGLEVLLDLGGGERSAL